MSTTTVKTIGTGGDYSTLQSWEDAAPANLTTSISGGEIWQGQLKNEVFNGGTSTILTMAGCTTDATGYKELTCVAGASFADNPSVQNNALRFDLSNGASVYSAVAYSNTIALQEAYARLTKLQVENSGTSSASGGVNCNTVTNLTVDRCIIESKCAVPGGSPIGSLTLFGSTHIVKNSLLINRRATSPGCALALGSGAVAVNCTLISSAAAGANAISGAYGSPTTKNCAIFGFTAIKTGGNTVTHTTGRTDVSGVTGLTQIAYDTTTGSGFQNITDATRDFRLKSSSAMINVGTTDATNGTPDIAGTARPSGASYDVGAWEYVAAGITGPLAMGGHLYGQGPLVGGRLAL